MLNEENALVFALALILGVIAGAGVWVWGCAALAFLERVFFGGIDDDPRD